jgi:hypothetical protein
MTRELATDLRGVVAKRVADSVQLYADFTEYLAVSGATISTVTVSCSDDATLTLGTPSVLSGSTNVPAEDEQGNVVSRTIAANKGCKVLVGAGTAQDDDDDPIRLKWRVVLSTGEIIERCGRIRIE